MADQKISQLPELLELVGNEDLVVASNHQNFRIKAGNVGLGPAPTKASIGLGNVDNTSDADKPISLLTQTALDGKSNVGHTHPINEVTELQAALTGKAAIAHNHSIMDVTGLSVALDDKADLVDLTSKSDVGHGHAMTDIDGLSAELGSIHSQLSGLDVSPHLDGSPTVYVNEISTYTITDFDRFLTYNISTDNGAVSLTDNIISYTPDSPGVGHLYINGKTYTLSVTDKIITAPTLTTPVTNTAELGPNVTFAATAFATVPVSSDLHAATDWEIASDNDFTVLVYSSYGNVLDLTDITVTLAPAQSLYARVRYRTDIRVSAWSTPVAFSTKADYIPASDMALLIASDKTSYSSFGRSVSLSATGDRVIIGSYNADDGAFTDNGKAYVFRREETLWIEEAILMPLDRVTNDGFGVAVSMDADGLRVAIGAYNADGGADFAGKVYVFTRSGTTWTEEQTLTSSTAQIFGRLGTAVAISSDGLRIAGCASHEDHGGVNGCGAVHIYSRSGTTWTEEALLLASDKGISGEVDEGFGAFADFDATASRIVIGSAGAKVVSALRAGKAYVFTRSGTAWTEETILTASDPTANANFGISVAISADGSKLVVGAPSGSTGGILTGKAYVFYRLGVTWLEESIIAASDRVVSDSFGYSVSMSNDGLRIVAGAYFASTQQVVECGKAYLYIYSGAAWNETTILTPTAPVAGDDFGVSLSLSNDGMVLAVGADYTSSGGIDAAGSVNIFM